jgi:FkbM family methyltransferase
MGRQDGQVKLRGYRVELGEIEASLRAHEAVESAVVLARADQTGGTQLVGYAVLRRPYREVLDGRRRYQLPNGMAIVQQNQNETDYQYEEIFRQASYLRHGVRLGPGMCVFDVGANIGMFTLYVSAHCEQPRIYAFEPIGEVCAALRVNAELYGREAVTVYECGLSDREGEASFTHYPRQTMMSGASEYADTEYEKEVVKLALKEAGAELLSEADELLRRQFETRTERCRLRRLSDVMREAGVERIDLLKVDVQRSEMDVLLGIEEADWVRVGQVVMEVHDRQGTASAGRVEQLRELLEGRGFTVTVEQEELLAETDRYNLYAVRAGWWEESSSESRRSAEYEAGVITSVELRRYLGERLPDYMVPSWIVLLDEWPLTANGKLDRRALPEPAIHSGEGELQQRTPTEEIVAGVWTEVLRLAEVDTEANFFDLGGHSLLATQVVSRLRAAFGIEVHLRSLFEQPTVRGLAEQIDAALKAEQGIETPPLRRVERNGALPLSYAQQRLWFLDQLNPGNSFYNVPAAVRMTGRLNINALEKTLTEIIRRHEVLRTSFSEVDGRPIQVIQPATDFTLPVVTVEHEAEVIRLAREEAARPFDLSCERPLLRVTLLKLEAEEHVVLFTMHHIVSDGWSVGVLLKEVATLYEIYSHGKSSPLPELAVQYADYAMWQREWLQGEALERQLSYWKRQLDGATNVLHLPADKPRPATQTFNGAHHTFSLTLELGEKLKKLSRDEDVTLFMTLLAAWQTLIYRYTNQEQITVGTPIANRNRPETEVLIGFFVNTLVINNDLSGDPAFRELLRRVREVCLGAYAHQDVPFEKLVEVLQPERSLSHTPLVQVWFAFQNAPQSKMELDGLSLTPLPLETGTAKFDLGLNLADTAEGLIASLEYKTDLFNPGTARQISSQFVTLLEHIAVHPEEKLSALTSLLIKAGKRSQREELQASKKINLNRLKGAERRAVSSW